MEGLFVGIDCCGKRIEKKNRYIWNWKDALYRKGMFDFFNHNEPNALGMINQVANRGHISASYVLAIISIFKGYGFMREGLMFIVNMKKIEPLKTRRCRHKLQYVLGRMWVPEPHLLGKRPICCVVHQQEQSVRNNGWPQGSDDEDEDDIRCELCSCDLELNYISNVAIFEAYIATYGPCVATYESNVATFEAYVATDDPCVAIYVSIGVLPFKVIDQPSFLVYLGGAEIPPILRVYADENPIEEDHNL
ncbi:hypothetical protein H5410_036662 [Solanum commersonii]|uniref:At2g35280-like TPR domain-containing protein n=1 Tax=Solanum commersonii TaxID=4109 RepID=A0A9J5Y8U9_SOLCO|nr:hypothetical protein H5410_036662 [Solanum commersonii]